MEFYLIRLIFSLILLSVVFGIRIGSVLSSEYFIISIERHRHNCKQTTTPAKPNRLIGRIRKVLHLSPKPKQSTAPDGTFEICNFTFKFTDVEKDPAQIVRMNEPETAPSLETHSTEQELKDQQKKQVKQQEDRDKRQKLREHIQEKYINP